MLTSPGVEPARVVDDAAHDRIRVDAPAEAVVPVLPRVLGAEQRRGRVGAALDQLGEEADRGIVKLTLADE